MTERLLPISDDDIRAVVRLLGQVAGMTQPLPERRRALMEGLAKLIDAEVWMWIHSGGWDVNRPIGLALIDGGWRDDAERNRIHGINTRDDVNMQLALGFDRQRPTTWLFDETHPGWGDGKLYREVIQPTGLTHLLFSLHPMPGGLFSGIGLHRREDRPPYTPRETAIAHLVLTQVDWLHYIDPPAIVQEEGLKHLTPREREVMIHLLGGDSRKRIAQKMGLSEHTIGDYFKSIYRRLNIGSRAELMAKFLPSENGPNSLPPAPSPNPPDED